MSVDIFWRIPTHGEPASHRSRTPNRWDLFPGYEGQTRDELPPGYSPNRLSSRNRPRGRDCGISRRSDSIVSHDG
jgi:hypothetical protein